MDWYQIIHKLYRTRYWYIKLLWAVMLNTLNRGVFEDSYVIIFSVFHQYIHLTCNNRLSMVSQFWGGPTTYKFQMSEKSPENFSQLPLITESVEIRCFTVSNMLYFLKASYKHYLMCLYESFFISTCTQLQKQEMICLQILIWCTYLVLLFKVLLALTKSLVNECLIFLVHIKSDVSIFKGWEGVGGRVQKEGEKLLQKFLAFFC